MNIPTQRSVIPIYTSRGDAEAFLVYPYLYNRSGEWIGWVTADRQVYSVLGFYVGDLTAEPRSSPGRPHRHAHRAWLSLPRFHLPH
jgi:hypothetical protein